MILLFSCRLYDWSTEAINKRNKIERRKDKKWYDWWISEEAIVRIRSHAPGDQVVIIAELPTGGTKTFTFTLDSAPALP